MRSILCALITVPLIGLPAITRSAPWSDSWPDSLEVSSLTPWSMTPSARQIITTALNEVQSGSVDGREFLTLSIDGLSVGPSTCSGTVLKVDTALLGDSPRLERIGTAALSAMLNAEPVSITVPLDTLQCVDGKPTFTDLRVLP